MYSFSIIVPVYNEVNIIEKFAEKLSKTFRKFNAKIIFVNDGSSDGTSEWLKKNLIKKFPNNNYVLIDLKKNYGKGYAVRKGIEKIEGDYTIFIDSDLEYEPIDGTNGDCQVQNHQKSYQTQTSSSKGNDQSKVRELRTLNTVVGSQSKAEPILTSATQYSSPVESTLGIRISEKEADLCCVAVVKRTWSLHYYTITDITNPDISWSCYCFSSDITCYGGDCLL